MIIIINIDITIADSQQITLISDKVKEKQEKQKLKSQKLQEMYITILVGLLVLFK